MSKINIYDFLEQNGETKQYAIVEYDGKHQAVCFINNQSKDAIYVDCKDKWSDFALTLSHKILDDTGNIEEECLSVVESLLKPDTDRKAYYEQYIKPMIIDNVYWEILYVENIHPEVVGLHPPKEVDDIITVTKRECLLYMLDIESFEALRSKRDAMKNLRKHLASSDKPFTNVGIPN